MPGFLFLRGGPAGVSECRVTRFLQPEIRDHMHLIDPATNLVV
jgi:hypothetical protein